MEVIGVGLGRTGTTSLKIALEELGYRTFHTRELFLNPAIFYEWHKKIFSKPSYTLGYPDFEAIEKAGFTASTDVPVALYYEDLMELYPHSKFILTTHVSSETWFSSWQKHVQHMELVRRYVPWLPYLDKIEIYTRWLIAGLHQGDDSFVWSHPSPISQNATMVMQSYEQHNDRVRQLIPSDRLLELNMPHASWEVLCDFLGKPIPENHVSFPNSSSTFQVEMQCWLLIVVANGLLLFSLWMVWKLGHRIFVAKKEPSQKME